MNWVDWVILAASAASVFAGLMDGLVKTVLSIASVVLGFMLAIRLGGPIGSFFEGKIRPEIAHALGFIVAFVVVLVAFAFVSWLLRKTLEKLSISWIDRLLGGVVGLARAAVFLGLVALLVDGFGGFAATRASKTFPYALRSGRLLLQVVPESAKARLKWRPSGEAPKKSKPQGNAKGEGVI